MARSLVHDTVFYCLSVYQVKISPTPQLGAASSAEGHVGQGAPGLMGNMNPEGGVNHENGMNRNGGVIPEGGSGNQEPRQQPQPPPEEPAQAAMEVPQPENMQPRIRRTKFTLLQVEELESVFRHTQYPDVPTRRELAENLGVAEDKVRVWFKNKRARCRRHQRELMLANELRADPDDCVYIVVD
ncbi:rhox homeobox family member 1 [Gorilla gorilla gorilla]|uniref:Rhox homeobox family member 1 n=1 Tax=Gorilla gorilla gorilla TaxID=9595 RepID=G3RJ43_GORGO|nr:rhox homeobox family member 1 [Gorilla gorilla gorilla]XP_055232216.1 rhox homeobox family member 1 [Gorilla gorilla gorilla]